MPTVKEIAFAIEGLGDYLADTSFLKSLKGEIRGERQILKFAKFFFAGRFYNASPESKVKFGRLDFLFDNVGLELAVRTKGAPKRLLRSTSNRNEIKKCAAFPGLSILALLDLEGGALTDADIESYRNSVVVGKGNRRYPFSVIYAFPSDHGFSSKVFRIRKRK